MVASHSEPSVPFVFRPLLTPFSRSVNVFYRVNQEKHDTTGVDPERTKQEREFKIGSIGLADSAGILMASLLAVPTEIELCRAQVGRGKTFCKSL